MLKKLKEWFATRRSLLRTIEALKAEVEKSKAGRVTVVNKAPQPKDDPWHLIMADDKEFWVRPGKVSYVSPIEVNGFTAIVDGVSTSFGFKDADTAMAFRNVLLNIDTIPKANTYERKKEPSQILKDIDRAMGSRKRITQEEVDAMEFANKNPN